MAAFDRYKTNNPTGLEVELYSGKIFQPRSYCDDSSASGIYQNKAPVCKLLMIPTTQFVSTSISWDISESVSATSTLATYSIDFGGGGVSNISGAAWGGAKTGTVQYDTAGTYTVEAFVKDLLDVESIHVFLTVEIVDPVERVYIGTSDSGVFISDNGSTPAASNSGLSGDDLKLRAIRLNPHTGDLPAAQQHVWLATKTGLAYSTDGAATWSKISKATLGTPVNTAADSPAPATADLDQIDVCFDPQDQRRIYCLRVTVSPARAWLYKSDNYGETWSNTQVFI